MGFALDERGSRQVSTERAAELMREAFDAWTGAACPGGGTPSIHVEDMGTVACDRVEYNEHAANVNLVTFVDEGWAHDPNALGNTTLSYDVETGEIFDADVEINSTAAVTLQVAIPPGWGRPPECDEASALPECRQYDLLSILTHEAGHFLGMAHIPNIDATMFPTVGLFAAGARSLHEEDVDAVCAAYPPAQAGTEVESCNPIPRHGFSSFCAAEQTEGDCSIGRAVGATPRTTLSLFLVSLLALRFRAQRRMSLLRVPHG
jgi:hypothetical protein